MPVVSMNPWSSARISGSSNSSEDTFSVTVVPASGGCASGRASLSGSDPRSALNRPGSAGHDSVPRSGADVRWLRAAHVGESQVRKVRHRHVEHPSEPERAGQPSDRTGRLGVLDPVLLERPVQRLTVSEGTGSPSSELSDRRHAGRAGGSDGIRLEVGERRAGEPQHCRLVTTRWASRLRLAATAVRLAATSDPAARTATSPRSRVRERRSSRVSRASRTRSASLCSSRRAETRVDVRPFRFGEPDGVVARGFLDVREPDAVSRQSASRSAASHWSSPTDLRVQPQIVSGGLDPSPAVAPIPQESLGRDLDRGLAGVRCSVEREEGVAAGCLDHGVHRARASASVKNPNAASRRGVASVLA